MCILIHKFTQADCQVLKQNRSILYKSKVRIRKKCQDKQANPWTPFISAVKKLSYDTRK